MLACPSLPLPGGSACCGCLVRTADGGEFRAHRAFLCATSPFFRAAFSAEYGRRRELLLRDVSAETLDILLCHYYLDQQRVTSDNVTEVLAAADMLLMDEARDLCVDYLLRNMDIDNCLGLARLAQQYHCPRFKDAIFGFVRENFNAVWRTSEEFPEAPASLLAEIIASDELNIRDEADLLHAVGIWFSGALAGNPERQDADLSRLLHCVRVGLCSQRALEEFRELHPAIAFSGSYHVAVCEAVLMGPFLCSPRPLLLMQLPALSAAGRISLPCPHSGGSNTDVNDVTLADAHTSAVEAASQRRCKQCGASSPERWLPRTPYDMLFVVGGWTAGEEREAVQAYDPRAKRWLMQPMEGFLPRAYHGVVLLRKKLYVVGGTRAQEYQRSCDCFDTESCAWEPCSPMHMARGHVAVVVLGDYVYAIGGRNETERMATVERYNPSTNQWLPVASMQRRRSEAAACVFRGKLYVSGGFSGEKVLMSVEEYTPSRDSWCLVGLLPGPRCSHQMVHLAGRVYVVGGYDGRQRVDTVFASSGSEGAPPAWQSMAPMRIRRCNFAVAQLDGEIYVIGGFDGITATADVERYSPATNTWHAVAPLNAAVSAMSACCVGGLAVARRLSAQGAFGAST